MTSDTASVVDPVFLLVLDFLARMDREEDLVPVAVQDRIQDELRMVRTKLGDGQRADLILYALVCWIDEMMIFGKWEGSTWWDDNKLEWEWFAMAERHSEFYERASKATEHESMDPLEVYYLAVILGFRGMYANPAESIEKMHDLGLEATTLEEWVERTAKRIRVVPQRTDRFGGSQEIDGVRPLEGPEMLIWSVFGAIALGVVFASVFLFPTT